MTENVEQEEKKCVNSCSICCELQIFRLLLFIFLSFNQIIYQGRKDMADDTKQDTSGFGTLLMIAEVTLEPIPTGGCIKLLRL